MLRRLRDFAQIKGNGKIDLEIAQYGLEALNVDDHGLDEMDNKILSTIIEKFTGGPVGLTTIATAVGEESGTIEEVHEPFLIMEGFIQRTPRGRIATEKEVSVKKEVVYVVSFGSNLIKSPYFALGIAPFLFPKV